MVNLEEHVGLIVDMAQKANKILRGRADYDELKSIVVFLLAKLATTFDETKSSFYHYAVVSKTAITAAEIYIKDNRPCGSEDINNCDIASKTTNGIDFDTKILDVLTEQERTLLLMRIVDNMSIAEISRATNIKRGKIQSSIERAIQTIRNSNVQHENECCTTGGGVCDRLRFY